MSERVSLGIVNGRVVALAMMSVKDVLQSLVDDGMVDSDRIGTSNYFWALPSKASNIVIVYL